MAELVVLRTFQGRERSFGFHDGITIIYGLKGETEIVCPNRHNRIEEAGMILLNPFEIHRIDATRGTVLEMRIERTALFLSDWNTNTRLSLYVQNADERFDRVRRCCAEIFISCFSENQSEDQIEAGVMNLFRCLQKEHFVVSESEEAARQSSESSRRLSRILQFIEKNWNQKLSLADIAKDEYLSPAYLSRFFKRYVGMPFSDYLRELRFQKAARMLTGSSDTITEIAYNCGFQSPSAFTEGFRMYYKVTPKEYRMNQEKIAGMEEEKRRYKDIDDSQNDMSALLRYLPEKSKEELPVRNEEVQVRVNRRSLRSVGLRMVLNIGYAHDGLDGGIRDMILRAKREIGFEYVRFHGIFDEDMHVYREENGKVCCDFTRLVLLIDFLKEHEMKPYIELGFLPPELAVHPNRIFDRPSVISGCRDLSKWKELISQTLRFMIARYGITEVREWRFTTISMNYAHLKCMSMEEYKKLYLATYQTVRETEPSLLIGGPGCLSELIVKEEGLGNFLDFAKKENCLPDFLTIQSYPSVDASADPLYFDYVKHQQYAPSVLSKDPDYLAHTLEMIEKVTDSRNIPRREIFCEEISSTLWQRDLSSDTCYKAAWMAKNLCENMDQAVFGYWTLSDLLEERAYPGRVFHGGYGLFTYNGIPKAGYFGLMFCGMMNGTLIGRGEGWLMVRTGGEYRLLLYHYCHYSTIYCYRYQRLQDPAKAYDVFEEKEVRHIRFHVSGIHPGQYRFERRKISRKSGSAFSEWVRMGAPDYLNPDEERYLKSKTIPDLSIDTVEADPDLDIEVTLGPLEVEMVCFRRI